MESQSDGGLQAEIKEKNDLIARLILKVKTAQSQGNKVNLNEDGTSVEKAKLRYQIREKNALIARLILKVQTAGKCNETAEEISNDENDYDIARLDQPENTQDFSVKDLNKMFGDY